MNKSDKYPKHSINALKRARLNYKRQKYYKLEIQHINDAIRYKQDLYFHSLQYVKGWRWSMSKRT